MSPSRRRLKIAAALVILVALALGWVFQLYTRTALERAEAFRFRRMVVTKQEEGPHRFFFVTNRLPLRDDGAVTERFRSERQAALSYGRFDTEIEPSLGIGMIIDPSDWFQNEEIRLSNVETLERAALVEGLRDQVRRSPYRSLLVNVNGFRERFASALRKTAFLGHVLDIDSPLLVFDWPGDQGSTLRGYRRAQRIADQSGEELASTLELILREIRPERLWLLANSMGAEVVVSALTRLYRAKDPAGTELRIEKVVLTAPDVAHEKFGRQFKQEIDALTHKLTVYVSSNDRALLMSRILNRGRRLGESTLDLSGESTLDLSNPEQSDEADRAFQLVEPGSDRVTLVDVTPVNRTRNFHNFGLEVPEFFDDLFLRLVNPEPPQSRLLYRIRTPDGRHYWLLTRGR